MNQPDKPNSEDDLISAVMNTNSASQSGTTDMPEPGSQPTQTNLPSVHVADLPPPLAEAKNAWFEASNENTQAKQAWKRAKNAATVVTPTDIAQTETLALRAKIQFQEAEEAWKQSQLQWESDPLKAGKLFRSALKKVRKSTALYDQARQRITQGEQESITIEMQLPAPSATPGSANDELPSLDVATADLGEITTSPEGDWKSAPLSNTPGIHKIALDAIKPHIQNGIAWIRSKISALIPTLSTVSALRSQTRRHANVILAAAGGVIAIAAVAAPVTIYFATQTEEDENQGRPAELRMTEEPIGRMERRAAEESATAANEPEVIGNSITAAAAVAAAPPKPQKKSPETPETITANCNVSAASVLTCRTTTGSSTNPREKFVYLPAEKQPPAPQAKANIVLNMPDGTEWRSATRTFTEGRYNNFGAVVFTRK